MTEKDFLTKLENLIKEFEESNNNMKIVDCHTAIGPSFDPLYVYNGEHFVDCTRDDE